MKVILLLLTFIIQVLHLSAQRTDKRLQLRITSLLRGFNGTAGVFVKNVKTNTFAAVNADSLFPTASMIKIPILIGIMDKIERGELLYHQKHEYRDSLLYPGVDILGSFKSGEKIELSKVLMLMLTMSDNTASLWLQSLAGTGTAINRILESLGCKDTRVNSRTSGRESDRALYGWGQTTPREMVTLLEKMYTGDIISKEASGKMIRLLGRNYWDEAAMSQVPPTVFVASKNGALDSSRSETLLVMAPHGAYIFTVATKNLTDTTWNQTNEGWVLARKLSKLLWNYYEPKDKWIPAIGVDGN